MIFAVLKKTRTVHYVGKQARLLWFVWPRRLWYITIYCCV